MRAVEGKRLTWLAKASLISKMSTSLVVSPADKEEICADPRAPKQGTREVL